MIKRGAHRSWLCALVPRPSGSEPHLASNTGFASIIPGLAILVYQVRDHPP